VQGQANLIVRYQGHVYQYQTRAITSLTFPTSNKADYAGTGTIQDITSPSSPITVYTGAAPQVTPTDNGEPGTRDTIGFTIRTPAGALWFSGDWNGTSTIEAGADPENRHPVHPSARSRPGTERARPGPAVALRPDRPPPAPRPPPTAG
jgi:hypothetical protein